MDHDYFLATLNEFLQKTQEIIEKLNEELIWINGHHGRCRAAKAAGTTLSVTGAAVAATALFFSLSTGGASIVAAAGYGAAVGLTGAAINVTTDITDIVTTKIVSDGIERICAERDTVANRLQKCLEELERQARDFKNCNFDEDIAYALALKGYTIYSTVKDAITLTRCAQAASSSANCILRNGGKYWRRLRIQSETLTKALGYFGVNITKTGAMAVVRISTALISGGFATYDAYSLIKIIKNNHPNADAMAAMIKCMKEEIDQISELRNESMIPI